MAARYRPGAIGRPIRAAAAVLTLCCGAWTGCAHVRPAEPGFLSDYTGLRPTELALHDRGGTEHVMVRPAARGALAGVDSFYVEPLDWRVASSREAATDPDVKARVLAAYDGELRQQLGKIRPVVDRPGPGTARVRSAVTDVEPAWPIANIVATAVATPIFNGGGAFEAEVIAPDSRQIAAVSSASTGGAFEFLSYFTRSWQPADASRRAADEIASAIYAGLP